MSGFGALRRIRTRKHMRTVRSIRTSTGRRGGSVYRDQETERLTLEEEQLKERCALHEQRRAVQRLLDADQSPR
ncbi:MAG: hypothetical protein KKC18_05220 [Chloroflexi bacterium]|nr:hypothetical protein [Chloroflexota bacterium]